MIPFIIGAAVVTVVGGTVTWICNAMTEDEKRLHSETEEKIQEYRKDYENASNQHNTNLIVIQRSTFLKIKEEYIKQIKFFSDEKSPIEKDLKKLKQALEEEIKNESVSLYAKKALMFEKNRIDDASLRLDGYWDYLKWYEEKLDHFEKKNLYTEILDFKQPNPLLPDDFLYCGKLAIIDKEELENAWNSYGQKLQLSARTVNNKHSIC